MQEKKKKILYLITQGEMGGAQGYVFDLAKNMQADYDAIIALGKSDKNNEIKKRLDSHKISYYELSHVKREISPIDDLLAIFEIRNLIKKIKPDIIHLNSSKISILGPISSIFTSPKIIYTAHGWVFNEPLPIWKKMFYKYAEKFTAPLKDKIICVSEFDYKTAIQEKICRKENLTTIHNGIKNRNLQTKTESLSKLQATGWELRDSDLIIGSIGHLYKTKGYKYLIRAIDIVVTKYKKNIRLFIIGEGDERKDLEREIKKLKLEKNIILTGTVQNASRVLPAFDAYVCSSVKEGFPYSIIEAMMSGLPIVSTNVGGISEQITDQKSGILVEPKNPEQLARGIIKLIDDKDFRERLGAEAKKKAEHEFTIEKMIQKTKEVYATL